MGLPMAEKLAAAHLPVVAFNRTAAKLDPLRSAGVTVTTSASEVLQQCAVVITMLTHAAAIQEVLLTDEARQHLSGRTVIQMGTIAPHESKNLQQEIAVAGGEYLEAPVLGSIPQVKAGQLQIMVGATPAQFQQQFSLLNHLGTPRLIGSVGTAAALKLSLNQLIASLTTAFALSLGFVQRQGVEVETFMEILRESALYAPTFDKKLQRMVEYHFDDPNFPTQHLLKDVNLFLTEAIPQGLEVEALQGVQQILQQACAADLAMADYSALFAVVCPQLEA